MIRLIQNCNKYVGDVIGSGSEPDMIFDESALMCVRSRNSERWVLKYEESLVGQLIVLIFLCTLFDYLLPKIRTAFERFYRRKDFYSAKRMEQSGYFGPLKMELKYDSGSAFHHILAGLLMTAGWALNGQTLLFRLGILTEVSIELLDIRDMFFSKGLWSNKLEADAYMVMLAHHLPGIGLILPLNLWCSCVDIWQRIAMAMELVGGGLLLANVVRKVVDDTPWNHLCLDTVSMVGWIWARFYVAGPLMIQLIKTGLEYKCKPTYALIVGGVVMTMFNTMIVIDFLMKIVAEIHVLYGARHSRKKLKAVY